MLPQAQCPLFPSPPWPVCLLVPGFFPLPAPAAPAGGPLRVLQLCHPCWWGTYRLVCRAQDSTWGPASFLCPAIILPPGHWPPRRRTSAWVPQSLTGAGTRAPQSRCGQPCSRSSVYSAQPQRTVALSPHWPWGALTQELGEGQGGRAVEMDTGGHTTRSVPHPRAPAWAHTALSCAQVGALPI